MKKISALFQFALCLISLSCSATNAYLLLSDAQLNVGPYYTNRTIWLQPLSTPTVNSPAVVSGTKIIVTNSATGEYTFTNLFPGLYHVVVVAPPSRDDFSFYFDSTGLGTINISDYLVADSTATFPAGAVAWAAAVTDLRYARTTNVNISFLQVSNALGFVPQPASPNLTNWSTLNTNIVGSKVGTNDVLGIGATNWVAMNGGGSTNQALLNPSLTNGVNRGTAFSSIGGGTQSEQFGTGALASGATDFAAGPFALALGGNGTAVGASANTLNGFGVAVGNSASSSATNATAIGANSTSGFTGSTALGALSTSSRPHQVMLGTSSDEVNVPGALSAASITNTAQTASTLTAADANKKLVSVTIGDGLAYDTGTRTLTATTAGSGSQYGSANLTNWSTLSTNVITPIATKVGTNDVLGIGATNYVALLDGGSTNQVLLNPSLTNGVNRGNAFSSRGTTAFSEQFGLSAHATGPSSTAVGAGAAAQNDSATALGINAAAIGTNAIAIGAGASTANNNSIAIGTAATALHLNSIVLGLTATSSRANQISLGSGEEVNVPGALNVTGNITNAPLTAASIVAVDANKALKSATLGNGLTVSGTTLSLNTDAQLSTSGGTLAVVGSAVTGLNGNNIASGTVPTARLGSGSANSSTYLRGDQTWATITGGGTVSSVGLSMPAEFSVVGTPVTGSGTLAVSKATQTANTVYAGPATGAVTAPTFRALVAADIPSLSASYWTLSGNTGGGFLGTTDNQALNFKTHSIQSGSLTENNGIPRVQFGHVGSFSMLGDMSGILSGVTNYIGGNETAAVIAGGAYNTNNGGNFGVISGNTISGGASNNIGSVARFATILGGFRNTIFGSYSIAGGRRASAQGVGQFVFADSTDAAFAPTVADSFNVRVGGGANFTVGLSNFCVNGLPSYFIPSETAIDQNVSSATLAITTLEASVAASHKYNFEATLFVNESVAGDGIKVSFGGGTATFTAFRAQTLMTDTALVKSQQVTAFNTSVGVATFTGAGIVTIKGYFEVSTVGTFTLQIAQNSHSTGTVTLYTGSNMRVYHSPN